MCVLCVFLEGHTSVYTGVQLNLSFDKKKWFNTNKDLRNVT